jgi:hypothetical protein
VIIILTSKKLQSICKTFIIKGLLTRRDLVLEFSISSNKLDHYNCLDSLKGLDFKTLDIFSTYKYKLAPSRALMYTSTDILI